MSATMSLVPTCESEMSPRFTMSRTKCSRKRMCRVPVTRTGSRATAAAVRQTAVH
ncbi:BQ5605_C068g12848 [Microbotryum silenes-dioicae]|uniref:BQ5605_C068g12848 protein n=1 Tax=Microbotryum silenes-dioicae TaxID=796604 RepID=A0A2X0MU53_9BASI|nr:BQ5605_C127g13342 [Microbotryum silenes-dioicae]SGY27811.1 BQ5605_C123g13316 [Microbotryum silenes-dioicae]SGZ11183.1 BQ5605_C107g13192 [Microbotryum silenes-dioicae]SGZ35028.1 BQ5605_C068g12848 [Microbotryum silenes-dioicae]